MGARQTASAQWRDLWGTPMEQANPQFANRRRKCHGKSNPRALSHLPTHI